jgi:hypothetical protein
MPSLPQVHIHILSSDRERNLWLPIYFLFVCSFIWRSLHFFGVFPFLCYLLSFIKLAYDNTDFSDFKLICFFFFKYLNYSEWTVENFHSPNIIYAIEFIAFTVKIIFIHNDIILTTILTTLILLLPSIFNYQNSQLIPINFQY